MRRGEMISFLGSAATWPLAAIPAVIETLNQNWHGTLTARTPMTRGVPPDLISCSTHLARRGYVPGQNLTYETRGVSAIEFAAEHRSRAIYEAYPLCALVA
jgi:hypothetical protein